MIRHSGIHELIAALDLPESSLVNQRVPKKLLLENGSPTTADKRAISDGVEELVWIAALKPVTIAVPEYRDDTHEYLEVAVLLLTLRGRAKTTRLTELVHRAIPYPVLLLTEQGVHTTLSLANKRWSKGETGKIILEDDIVCVTWDNEYDQHIRSDFRSSLALGRQPQANLHVLYQGLIDKVVALNTVKHTGHFTLAKTPENAADRRDAMKACEVLQEEITRLRTRAAKEKQIPRQVELNLELKRIEAQLAIAIKKL